jgi:large-conductance mechanosensitive channel
VASFGSDGAQKVFSPPRRFTFFDLTEGTAFPKGYVVTLVLAEIDSGGFNDFIKKLMEKVKERVIAALTAALGGAIGASGGPVGVIIGLAVGYVVGKVFELISNIWKDDVFPPVSVRTSIPSLTARWTGGRTDSPERTVTFKGHGGQYTVTYDWQLFA